MPEIVTVDLEKLAEMLDGTGSQIPEGHGAAAWLDLLRELIKEIDREAIE